MPPPLTIKPGAIIAVSVAVAAGIAIYQSPQVQRWLDDRRRKIAIALHKLGNEINPPSRQCGAPGESEEQWTKRQEIIRRRRNDLIKRARDEGIAVDLDELAKISENYDDEKRPTTRGSTFDDLVHNDGTLRESGPAVVNEKPAAITTATDNTAAENLRLRGQGARGLMSGASFAQPFGDEEASILFDRDLIGVDDNSVDGEHDDEAVTPHDFIMDSRDTSATVEAQPASSLPQLIDFSEPAHAAAIDTTGEAATESYYSSASRAAAVCGVGPTVLESPAVSVIDDSDLDDNMAHSTGTLTPTEDNFSTDASLIGHSADDVAVLSSLHHALASADETSSNPFGSEAEMSEDARSEASFSDLGGAATPSSWTDVGSDAGSEYGGSHAGN